VQRRRLETVRFGLPLFGAGVGAMVAIHEQRALVAIAYIMGVIVGAWLLISGAIRWLRGEPFPASHTRLAVVFGAPTLIIFFGFDRAVGGAYATGFSAGCMAANVWATRAARRNRPGVRCGHRFLSFKFQPRVFVDLRRNNSMIVYVVGTEVGKRTWPGPRYTTPVDAASGSGCWHFQVVSRPRDKVGSCARLIPSVGCLAYDQISLAERMSCQSSVSVAVLLAAWMTGTP